MPTLRTYSVFICHDWEYSDEYHRIREFLDGAPDFQWQNLSVPKHKPLDTDDMLQKKLRDQIRPADVMLVLAGMYTARSEWMDWEMEFARRIGKSIIGVKPWGNVQLPVVVQENANEIVGWNTGTIVDAIRRYSPRY
ncbi:MAG: TIR domain-containing protein [Gemmatimonadaceae bacterium]|nr:TIR domain-containing protein [Gemmatimonadaceae bacterium]